MVQVPVPVSSLKLLCAVCGCEVDEVMVLRFDYFDKYRIVARCHGEMDVRDVDGEFIHLWALQGGELGLVEAFSKKELPEGETPKIGGAE